jgi:hypothetical protein
MSELIRAEWGLGASWIDCTNRVRQLLKDGRTFYANPSELGSDPVSGVRKQLELTFAGDPATSVTLNEGDCISKAVARVERLQAITRQAQAGMEAISRLTEPLEVCLDGFHEEDPSPAAPTATSPSGIRVRPCHQLALAQYDQALQSDPSLEGKSPSVIYAAVKRRVGATGESVPDRATWLRYVRHAKRGQKRT